MTPAYVEAGRNTKSAVAVMDREDKTTNLQSLHSMLPPDVKGKLISMATEGDRTIFFDFLPVEIGKINDFRIRFQLYTVPGQVMYNATRRLVLKGADGIVFVADSQRQVREQNLESLDNMWENLKANNISTDIQMNQARSVEALNELKEIFSELTKKRGFRRIFR